ncbi:MAG: coproporphyrinogen III oxidase, partial [Candidatus Marinimicrobia bacterium]|nr:coproporphyrinogen III oxidase [Candidatus Neomarinimicrobiota bacterium]
MNKKSGIYIHFPFCNVKCGYCDFYSIVNRKETIPYFIESVIKEIDLYFYSNDLNELEFDTIFLGGGTPSLIEPHYIEKIFKTLSNHINFSMIKEITIEANPGEASKKYLNGYKEIGINRISFGFQSLDDKLLKFLDRLHSAKQCILAFEEARIAGFENINTDMIFNIPGQSLDILSENLKSVIKLQPEHISSYSLTVEKGTMLYSNVSKGKVVMPDEELDYNMYEMTSSIMSDNKYSQYEASNYAKNDKECLHNLHYWNLDPYIAFGPSA